MRRLVASFVSCLAVVAATAAHATDPAAERPVSLDVGEVAFWDGGYVVSAQTTELPSDVACAVAQCYSWTVHVAPHGWRLRAALDTPSREDTFTLELFDPKGELVDSASDNTVFDEEVFAHRPAAGDWTVRVVPRDDAYASFRMRAKLESRPAPYEHKTLLLPNMQVTPPYEFGFVAPANPANGAYPPDTANPPLDVLGYHPLSCTADETFSTDDPDAHPTRCLRLTTGPRNAGPGVFEVHYNTHDLSDGFGATKHGPARQWIYYSDGSHITRPAGEFEFHLEHGHYHYDDILQYRLYKVTDRKTGKYVHAGKGVKSGFCPADELFTDWHTFDQAESSYGNANCGYTGSGEGVIGQSQGWGDVYRYQRPGQYVDFGTNGDGFYLVRATADLYDHVLETNENDNSGYALIHVVGDHVNIVERGQGMSPWDPHKTVFTDQ